MAVAQPLLAAVWQQITGARRPRRFGAPDERVPSLNRRECHNDSHLRLILAQETAVKARDGRVTSPDLSEGSL
jgi:hypothetical protein